ncbi:MAG: aromatic ring-hydroxylating dioxygenase subunit alpha [Chromatiales bacterium]|nr:aromatic ring-hydroxylating dioxygenase subunit alpha [Chromatiales bacterium]
MYINFWYPIGLSKEIGSEKPFRTTVLGLRFVAFRDDEGKAHVLSDTCVHRGGSLGKGWVKDNCVVCPYHGWRYGTDGKVREIPSMPGKRIPGRAKVDSYPVEERYGIVFAFLGDLPEEERPPLYTVEEFGQDGWRASEIVILELDAYFERSIENGLDPSHNEFVHPTQGNPGMEPDYLHKGLGIENDTWGHKFFVQFDEKGTGKTDLAELRSTKSELRAGSGHHGPNILGTWINFSKTNAFHQYFFEAPVDENHTRIFFLNTRNCMLDPSMDQRAYDANIKVANEDMVVLRELNPVRTPENNVKEILTPSDGSVVRYREFLGEWESRGWRIDLKKMRETAGDIAYAIPSPERRKSGNWVLDPVPLMPAEQNAGRMAPQAENREAG